MINITIIGFGYVGSSLSLLLLNSEHAIRLNLMDPNPECKGAFLDLAHGMSLFQNKELHLNKEELLRDADFIYCAAGIPNEKGASRLSIARENTALAKVLFEGKTFSKQPYVIVITNPVDVISYAIYRYSNIPPERIIGTGTFLDSIRLEYYLSEVSGIASSDIKGMVVGEHGHSQVPVYSNCEVEGQPLLQHSKFSNGDLELAHLLTRDAANKIRETQGGTTYGVSKCAVALLELLFDSKERHSLTLSMLTNDHYRSLLGLRKDIYIGLPVFVWNGEVTINEKVSFQKEELEAFQASAKILSEVIE